MNRKILKAGMMFLLALLFISPSFSFGESLLWGRLKPGPNAVGFQTIFQYDSSRPYKRKVDYEGKFQSGERARPMQINIWYPASQANGQPMTFVEYIQLTATEDSGGEATAEQKRQSVDAFLKSRWAQGVDAAKLQEVIGQKTAAIRNAVPDPKRFPLLLVANSVGLSSPYTQALLCEYLASHGYVIASMPSRGLSGRQTSFDSIGVLAQMQDLQYAIQLLHQKPFVDRDRLGLIGFSFGALATSLLAMHNTDVDAYVSLDGSGGNRYGYSVIFQNPLYEPSKLTVPTLSVSQESNPDSDTSFFKALKYSNIHRVRFKGMRAGVDFSSLGMIASLVPNFGGEPVPQGSKWEDRKAGHEALCVYTLNFLNASIRKDPQAQAFLQNDPVANGFASNLVTVDLTRGLKAPPTEEQFVKIIREKGIQEANVIYHEVSKNDPDYDLFEPESLNALGEQLIQQKKMKEAIEVLKLNVEAFPDFWLVYDSLGKAYMSDGNKQLAIENFAKSLQLNPNNQNAIEMLKKLQES
jgi:dienelactone hydrolase